MKKGDNRINTVLGILLKYIEKDFSQAIPISDEGDEIDALSAGLNTMAEEMQAFIVEEKKQEARIRKMNTDLELKVAERTEELHASEKKFRALIERNADMMTLSLPDGKLLYSSPSVTKTLGYTAEEFKKTEGSGFVHPEDVRGLIEQLKNILDKPGASFFRQHRLLHKNGSYVWCEGTITNMLHDPDIGALVSNFRDISERKETEQKVKKLNEELEQKVIERTAQLEQNMQQLKESEEKFQKAFQGSAAGISITRLSDSVYIDVNDAFIQLTGYKKEELIGHTSVELGFVLDFKKREEVLEEVRKKGAAKNFELSVRHKSGKLLQILSSVETIVLKGEKFAINIIYDITERKKSEEQLQAVNKELEAFSYSVSHDLRAPLRAVNGYAEILNEDYGAQFDEEGKRILQNIKYNASKMGMLIDDLLAFSRLGRKEMQKTVIDMNELVEGVMIEMSKTIQHKAEIKTGKLHKVKADYGLLHQVMVNLISNAIKYSSKKEHPFVEINSEEQKGEIIFSVKDNGAGFDMRYYDKLFGVFQRLHLQEEFEGTGVGLATVQRIIAKHSGKIWAEAKVNEGAVFHFTLPGKING